VPLSAAVGSVNATPCHLCAVAAVAKENGAENALEKVFKVKVLSGNDVRGFGRGLFMLPLPHYRNLLHVANA